MIIKPKVRGFICTSAHPEGCAANVQAQINYVKQQGNIDGPKKVLIIGASTGYGLASRITTAFGCGAATLGVFFEKEPLEKRCATAGWYNSAAFQQAAKEAGLYAESINGDAFSDEVKAETIAMLKDGIGQVDMVVYSLASPRRQHPKTGEIYNSVLKPVGQSIVAKTLDTDKGVVKDVELSAATDDEIAGTVKVMGGEDWEMWIAALNDAGLLAEGCQTIAYTYIGDRLTRPLYGDATIGKAKEDLDRAVAAISGQLQSIGGRAFVAVLKALVTQSSSAIPMMPLYISILYKVMKERGTHEGCIEQVQGLFAKLLIQQSPETDDQGRLRMDGNELLPEVQRQVEDIWQQVNTDNVNELTDYKGYQTEFLKLFGFSFDTVDYSADVDPVVTL